uniref:Epithelial stromal interaction 1 n=1 Tax=Cyprinus carpio carpio TaxID=630221 RepID=A0A9J8BJU4_CYPCA
MDRSTHLNHNSEGSGAYRGHPVNQRMTDSEQTDEYSCENNSPSTSNPQNQPTHADGYTKIPPNESRWSKLQRIAKEEEENLRRWKEENRPGPIQLTPERLGGAVSLAEVRQRQQDESRLSKLRKKLRNEEMDKKKRQAEEEENEKMKAMQREKADKLEMMKKQDEEQRQNLYQHDKQRLNVMSTGKPEEKRRMLTCLRRKRSRGERQKFWRNNKNNRRRTGRDGLELTIGG